MAAALERLPQSLPDGQEFAWLPMVTPEVVAMVCRLGYMPMAMGRDGAIGVLVKCHHTRCMVDPAKVHVSRSVVPRAQRYEIAMNHDFPTVLARVAWYHRSSWFSSALVEALIALHARPYLGVHPVTVAVRERSAGTIVAGEVGYAVGNVYTSLSGFHTLSGSGSVQMVALASILTENGCTMWDLGMPLPYKVHLGARSIDRVAFLDRYREWARRGDILVEFSGWKMASHLVERARDRERIRRMKQGDQAQ